MKKLLFLNILILSIMVIGVSCSLSTPSDVNNSSKSVGNESVEKSTKTEYRSEYLPGEIPEGENREQNNTLIGEIDSEEILNNNTNINIADTSSVRIFNMIARQFEFEPATINVKKGNKVIINIQSEDVEHGFTIEEYNINKTIPAGGSATIEFIADKVGKFEYYCSIYCGVGHSNMRGQLVVE